eukprot:UN22514
MEKDFTCPYKMRCIFGHGERRCEIDDIYTIYFSETLNTIHVCVKTNLFLVYTLPATYCGSNPELYQIISIINDYVDKETHNKIEQLGHLEVSSVQDVKKNNKNNTRIVPSDAQKLKKIVDNLKVSALDLKEGLAISLKAVKPAGNGVLNAAGFKNSSCIKYVNGFQSNCVYVGIVKKPVRRKMLMAIIDFDGTKTTEVIFINDTPVHEGAIALMNIDPVLKIIPK